ncbi:MAG: hypothetical protein WBQ72_05380 [Terriglobales bacterium]
MRRNLWSFVLLLLIGVFCAAAVPPTDLPETSYNEADTPVNQAPPVALGIRFVRPANVVGTVPRAIVRSRWDVQPPFDQWLPAPASAKHDSHSVQDLLCTLLI